jgi:hypothetical protein
MDKGTRQGSQGVDAAAGGEGAKSPEQLQQDIAETRAQLGDTVEALAGKADVKGQAEERISDLKGTARQKKEQFTTRLKAVAPEDAAAGAQQVAAKAKTDPLPFAVGGAFLIGVVVGRISSR